MYYTPAIILDYTRENTPPAKPASIDPTAEYWQAQINNARNARKTEWNIQGPD